MSAPWGNMSPELTQSEEMMQDSGLKYLNIKLLGCVRISKINLESDNDERANNGTLSRDHKAQ